MKRFIINAAACLIFGVTALAAAREHTVTRGDTLWKIARQYHVTFEELVAANPQITSVDLIVPGAKITIPDVSARRAVNRPNRVNHTHAAHGGVNGTARTAPGGTVGATAAAPANAALGAETASIDDRRETAAASEVVGLCNAYRAELGLAPLTVSDELSRVARSKAGDLGGTAVTNTPFETLAKFGVKYETAGENVAFGFDDPNALVNAWISSEGNRANILNAYFTEAGVGCAEVGGVKYWTLILVGR